MMTLAIAFILMGHFEALNRSEINTEVPGKHLNLPAIVDMAVESRVIASKHQDIAEVFEKEEVKVNEATDHEVIAMSKPQIAYTGYMRVDEAYQAFVEMLDTKGELLATKVMIGDALFQTGWTVLEISPYDIIAIREDREIQYSLSSYTSSDDNKAAKNTRKEPDINPVDGMIHDPAYGLIDPDNPDPYEGEALLVTMASSPTSTGKTRRKINNKLLLNRQKSAAVSARIDSQQQLGQDTSLFKKPKWASNQSKTMNNIFGKKP